MNVPNAGYHEQHECSRRDYPSYVSSIVEDVEVLGEGVPSSHSGTWVWSVSAVLILDATDHCMGTNGWMCPIQRPTWRLTLLAKVKLTSSILWQQRRPSEELREQRNSRELFEHR